MIEMKMRNLPKNQQLLFIMITLAELILIDITIRRKNKNYIFACII